MATFHIVQDAFNPQNRLLSGEWPGGSIGAWVDTQEVDYRGGPFAIMVIGKDGKSFPLRSEWDSTEIQDDESMWVLPHVGDFGLTALIVSLVALVASVVIASMIKPPVIGERQDADPVYSSRGQRNQNRRTSPIEDPYGRNRLWPSYAAAPYASYIGNNQILYQLFSLGHGEYDIEAIQIEDTAIDNFQEVEYEVIQPNGSVSLFPNNVVSSAAVVGLELLGPNEGLYPTTVSGDVNFPDSGWYGPFAANESNTEASQLQVDVIFPIGIYALTSRSGRQIPLGIDIIFEYRGIDSVGDPVGGGTWSTLKRDNADYNSATPIRQTWSKDVPLGRYEVRARRTDDKSEETGWAHTIKWEGLRAFLPSVVNYGEVTLLAVKAQATNNLQGEATSKINVIATRKVPIYDSASATWSAPTATRNPIWAFTNILKASYGGAMDDVNIDLDFLSTEAALAATRGETFDWVFDSRVTLWEALKAPAGAMRAVPMLNGAIVTIIRDQLRTVPSQMFSPDTMVKGSFKLQKSLISNDTNDGLVVEYIDHVTWKSETVDCFLPGDTGINPKRLNLKGVTDRTRAFRFGMYQRSVDRYENSQTRFQTGLEGMLATYGDLVRVSSDVPRWGQSGYIKSIIYSASPAVGFVCSEPLEWEDGGNHVFATRDRFGTVLQYVVTGTNLPETANEVYFGSGLPDAGLAQPDIGIVAGQENQEPPPFSFGKLTPGKLCRVVGITPSGSEAVGMTCVINDDRRFAYDNTTVAALGVDVDNTLPALPVVFGLDVIISPTQDSVFIITWGPAVGATSYQVEWSSDGVTYYHLANTSDLSVTSSYLFDGTSRLYIRVAGQNVGLGPWATWNAFLEGTGPLLDDVGNTLLDNSGNILQWSGDAAAAGTAFEILNFDGTDRLLRPSGDTTTDNLIDDEGNLWSVGNAT